MRPSGRRSVCILMKRSRRPDRSVAHPFWVTMMSVRPSLRSKSDRLQAETLIAIRKGKRRINTFLERKGRSHPNVYFLPLGVGFTALASQRISPMTAAVAAMIQISSAFIRLPRVDLLTRPTIHRWRTWCTSRRRRSSTPQPKLRSGIRSALRLLLK